MRVWSRFGESPLLYVYVLAGAGILLTREGRLAAERVSLTTETYSDLETEMGRQHPTRMLTAFLVSLLR